jgi:hypothetical protein
VFRENVLKRKIQNMKNNISQNGPSSKAAAAA